MSKKLKETPTGLAEKMREFVFGAEDGLVSTLGVVTGVAAGSQSSYMVILSGLVVIAVESISMWVGAFLSSSAARGVEEKILKEGMRNATEDLERTKEHLKKTYIKAGIEPVLAKSWAEAVVQNPQFLKKEILFELGIGDAIKSLKPFRNAGLVGVSYIAAGAVAVVPYFFLSIFPAMALSIFLTIIALFLVGAAKTKYTLGVWWKDGLQMVFVSIGAAALGYLVGVVVEKISN